MGTASQTLASLIARARSDELPSTVLQAAVRQLIDTSGVALGSAAEPDAAVVVDMARAWASATESTVIGFDVRTSAPVAAFIGARFARMSDLDDLHIEADIHPSCVVVPAAVAVAEEVGATGDELVRAIVAGTEILVRVTGAAPGRFTARGLDPTGTCGAFGAAAAAATLWNLTEVEIERALSIVASGVGAPLRASGVAMAAAWAAHAGVVAADLARRGSAESGDPFAGPDGIYARLLPGESEDVGFLTGDPGDAWASAAVATKRYPVADILGPIVAAAARTKVRWADIEEVVVPLPPTAVALVAEPRATRIKPADVASARRSLPFTVASAIVGGREPRAMFGADALDDRRVWTVAEHVIHEIDPSLPPYPRGATVRIHTRAGRTHEIGDEVARGHPDRPMTERMVREKFLAGAEARLGDARALEAYDMLSGVGSSTDAVALARSLGTPPP